MVEIGIPLITILRAYLFGSIPILINSFYSMRVTDLQGNSVLFASPIFMTLVNCLAMCLYCFLPTVMIPKLQSKRTAEQLNDAEEKISGDQHVFPSSLVGIVRPRISPLGFLILDLLGKTLKMTSLLLLQPSVFQISRCTCWCWTTFLFSKGASNRKQVFGLILCFLSFLPLSISPLFGSHFQMCNDRPIITILIGLLCNQLSLIFETITSGLDCPSFVGFSNDITGRGFLEIALIFVLMYPIAYIMPGPCGNHLEIFPDSVQLFFKSDNHMLLVFILLPLLLCKEIGENEDLNTFPRMTKYFFEWHAAFILLSTEYKQNDSLLVENNLWEVTRSWKLGGVQLLSLVMLTIGSMIYSRPGICNGSFRVFVIGELGPDIISHDEYVETNETDLERIRGYIESLGIDPDNLQARTTYVGDSMEPTSPADQTEENNFIS